jgi:hypothetical protein
METIYDIRFKDVYDLLKIWLKCNDRNNSGDTMLNTSRSTSLLITYEFRGESNDIYMKICEYLGSTIMAYPFIVYRFKHYKYYQDRCLLKIESEVNIRTILDGGIKCHDYSILDLYNPNDRFIIPFIISENTRDMIKTQLLEILNHIKSNFSLIRVEENKNERRYRKTDVCRYLWCSGYESYSR